MPVQVVLRGEKGLALVADVYGASASPPAVFFHGSGQTRQSWGRAADALSGQGWRVYTVDHRGHGDSDRAPKGKSDTALFRGLVLVDIAPTIDLEGARRIVAFMSANPDGYESLDDASVAIGAYRGNGKGAPSHAGLERVLRQGDDGRWRWHWDPRLLDSRRVWLADPSLARVALESLRSAMMTGAARLDVPTLLVRGGSSDLITTEAAQELVGAIPHATFVDVTGAGHMVAGDRNDAFTAEVLRFAAALMTPTGH